MTELLFANGWSEGTSGTATDTFLVIPKEAGYAYFRACEAYWPFQPPKKAFLTARETLSKTVLLACKERGEPIPDACERFNISTADGRDMAAYSRLLAQGIRSMVEHKEERDIDSLFSGPHELIETVRVG